MKKSNGNVNVFIGVEEKERLMLKAVKEGKTIKEAVREAIEQYLEGDEC